MSGSYYQGASLYYYFTLSVDVDQALCSYLITSQLIVHSMRLNYFKFFLPRFLSILKAWTAWPRPRNLMNISFQPGRALYFFLKCRSTSLCSIFQRVSWRSSSTHYTCWISTFNCYISVALGYLLRIQINKKFIEKCRSFTSKKRKLRRLPIKAICWE